MNKKSFAASTLVIFLAMMFSVIGICFSRFVYHDTKIEIKEIKLKTATGIDVFYDEECLKKATTLKLSEMKLGLKPATGEVNQTTQIPSTITNQGTSEGYYSTVYVKSTNDYKIVVKNVVIETKKDKIEVHEERKNIFISIMDVENSTKSIEKTETEIVLFEDVSSSQKLVFLIWLGAFADEVLVGAKISFDLEFIAV